MTQHGKRYPSGEIVISSKFNIKAVIDINVQIRPILLKTGTQVEFSGQNDNNKRNIRDSVTIALWEISDGMFLNLGC